MTNHIHLLFKPLGCALLTLGIVVSPASYSDEIEGIGERDGWFSRQAESERDTREEHGGLFSRGAGTYEESERGETGHLSSGGRGEHEEGEEENGHGSAEVREEGQRGLRERMGGFFSGRSEEAD